ncbi:YihY family inner membrane protein [Verticiella alkaliphila]|uniref:YihY family inner membrane protein n=1 Tax=Verticiella alkaliphila TaxID=2779529 RepID=UPI0035303A3D
MIRPAATTADPADDALLADALPPEDKPVPAPMRDRPAALLRLLRFAAQRAGEENVLQVGSALTFTTVLSLVPMLAVVFAFFTAFPLFAQFRLALDEFMVTSLMPVNVADTVMNYLNQFALQASRLSALGGLFLVVTAVSLIMTIDKAFNDIWHVTRQRPLMQRMLVYWAVLSLGPIMLGASLWTTSFLARESLGLVGDLSAMGGLALTFLPMLVSGLCITAMFLVVPNRYVRWRDALTGGFGTAIVLELMKTGLAWYLTKFPTYTVVYGAFAILPIFLLWLWLSWVVVLFGATVAASMPLIRLGRLQINRQAGAPYLDALNVLRELSAARGSVPPGLAGRTLNRRLQLNHDELAEVLDGLAEIGYVARIGEGARERWALVCDPAVASLGPVLDRFLLDRSQPVLANDAELRRIVHDTGRRLAHGEMPTLAEALASPDAQIAGKE